MKKGKLFIVALLASSLMLSACDLSFLDENGENQQQQAVSLTKIAVSKQPNKLVYEINETLDTNGLEVTATYSDSSTKVVTESVVVGSVDMSTRGKKDVKLSYSEDGSAVITSFQITVNEYCTITFNANGGSGLMESQRAIKDEAYVLPECTFVAPENKAFDGWKINYNKFAVGTSVLINTDTTIYAMWQDTVPPVQTYTVTYDSNGGNGQMASQTLEAGQTLTLPLCGFTAPSGQRFKTWQIGSSNYAIGATYVVNSDIVVKAIWEDIPVTKYTVTFDKNGGSGSMDSLTVNAGTTITLPENKFTAPTNKIFDGWSINNQKYAIGASFVVSANTTVKATWVDDPNAEFTVTFSANGGSGSMPSQTLKYGTVITLPANEFGAPSNRVFKNWQIGSTNYEVGATYTVTANVTVKAYWEYIKRTITFDANGGTGTMSPVQVNSGSSYTLPSSTFTAPSGKAFKAWQIGTTEYNAGASITVTSDLTLKALWKDKPAAAAWTLMVYLCGSSLESGEDDNGDYHPNDPSKGGLASMDIEEILNASGQPDNVNIIIQTGGSPVWASKYGIRNDKLGRYYVENGQLKEDPTNSSLSQGNMGDGATLTSFLEWGMTRYPAEKYGIFMWNHGGAMTGCCFDDNYDGDGLWVDEMDAAFTAARTNQGYANKFEFVAYDACLMAIQDIAELNSHNFNYMLSSQESESGYGYVYDAWLPDLYNNPTTISTQTLLTKIGSTFMDEEEDLFDYWNEPFDQTQSVYDLNKIASYKTAFESLALSLQSKITDTTKWGTFVSNCVTHSSVQKYGASNGKYLFGIYNATDVLDRIATQYSDLSTKVQNAKDALGQVVVYEEHGDATRGCGMNIFCPTNSKYNRYYSSDTNFTNWYTLCKYSGNCQDM